MIKDEEHWRSLIDAFHTAAINADGWYAALDGLAQATGSRCGELIGVGADSALPFNLMTNIDEVGFNEDFLAAGGPDPRFNPRVRAGLSAPPRQVLTESDFITEDEHKRHLHYELSRRWDVPYSCLATLEREGGMLVGLAVLRSEREGHIEAEERAAFAALAPVVRAAVRIQSALADQRAALLSGVLEALSTAAFISDRCGLVEAVTTEAERLIAGDSPLQLKGKRFRAAMEADTRRLNDAIQAAAADAGPNRPLIQTVLVRGEDAAHALVLNVIALPAETPEIAFGPRVLILAPGRKEEKQRKSAVLKTLYALTEAETDVALELAAGKTPDEIATCRGVKVGTVRAQTKSLLAKVRVKRQVELVAQLGRLQLLS